MNVVNLEKNNLALKRGRGRGRGRNRAEAIAPNNRPLNILPKYEFHNPRLPLVTLNVSTSANTSTTPRNPRRGQTTSSSSVRNSAFRRLGQNTGTSAQLSTGSATTEPDTCNILAITTGRGDARGEVGMAVVDVRHPHMILCQISDCHTYTDTLSKIHIMQPIEIIMPDTMCERSIYPNCLYRAIREKFPTICITEVARMHFHDSDGLDRIRSNCAEEFANVELYVKQKYYALAAAAALLKYVEYIQHITYAPKSMKIDFHGSQNSAMIDIESAENLELVTSQGGPAKFSLLGSLDRCSTPMGRRLLRVSILQPSCNLEIIQSRQACVAEFVSNRSLHAIVQPVVKRLYGTSHLLSLGVVSSQADAVLAAEKNLNFVLLLKNIMNIIPELESVLASGQAPFFRKVCEDLRDPRFKTIKQKILCIIHPEAQALMGFNSANMQRCFAIRSGISDMLDVVRQAYCELIDDMQSLVKKLATKYNLPLSLSCNAKLGYHIEMAAPRRENVLKKDFPAELIEVHHQKGKLFMTTEYLMVLSQHCKEACQELHLLSNVLLNETLTGIREHIGCLLKLSDDVAELDIVSSLAHVSAIPDFVRPTFGSKLQLKSSRHPVMDIWGVDGSRAPVPNDVYASVFHNFHTITGPNMSGKSVYLKQIVLLQIMAQIGCYVPASEARFRISDRIFCRMCKRDDIECDAATFVLEVKEILYILQSITPTSLVILDELCRSTSVEEGTSIAWAIAEKLIRNSQAFVFNATHFLYLTRLAELFYSATNHYFETETNVVSSPASSLANSDTRLIYTHKLKSGIANVWNYGITLARSTGLPREIVTLSQRFANEIAKSVKPVEVDASRTNRTSNDLYYNFVVELSGLLESQQLTVKNIAKIAQEKNIPNINVIDTKQNVIPKLQPCAETSTSDTSHEFVKPKIYEPQLPLKRQPPDGVFSVSSEIKKPRPAESSQPIVQFSDKKTEVNPNEPCQKSYVSMKIANALDIRSSPAAVSLVSANGQRNNTTSVSQIRQTVISPNMSTTSNHKSWKSAVEDVTGRSHQSPRYSVVSSTASNNSEDSISTPFARIMAREKEANIFRIIEGKEFDETSFYNSFMNPTISIGSSEED